jgi:hypothetical protein
LRGISLTQFVIANGVPIECPSFYFESHVPKLKAEMAQVTGQTPSGSIKSAAAAPQQDETQVPTPATAADPNEQGQGSGGSDAAAAADSGPAVLTSPQLHSLFDILTHYHTYSEVESFKDPTTIAHYGRPFALKTDSPSSERDYASTSSAPLLASFLKSVVLPLPGVRDLSPDFWSVRFQGILVKLADAELSESYDKGVLGTRKTLSTVASVIQETAVRGILGGFPRGAKRDLGRSYDASSAQDLSAAWEDAVHELVYGDLIDELFECAIHDKNLEKHSPAIKTASDYVIIQ